MTTKSTCPNMMYHFELICGESPGFATVKAAPSEPYEGEPCGVKESEAPFVKSMSTDRPSAEFGGQPPSLNQLADENNLNFMDLPDVRGLQAVKVWAEVRDDNVINAATAAMSGLKNKICIANMGNKKKERV